MNLRLLHHLAFILFLHNGKGQSYVAHLQTDNIATKDSGLTWRGTGPKLTSFSLCTRLFSYRTRWTDYFLSYATQDNDNELSISLKYDNQQIRIACCEKRMYEIFRVPIRILQWFSFCVTADFNNRIITMSYSNSSETRTIKDSNDFGQRKEDPGPMYVAEGGLYMFGQDQDKMGGDTDLGQSFNGLIADLYFSQEIYRQDQINAYIECRVSTSTFQNSLIHFEDLDVNFDLGVKTNMSWRDDLIVCDQITNMVVVFPEGRDFTQANHFCSIVNGKVATPLSDRENKMLHNAGAENIDKCSKFDKGVGIYTGVMWDYERQVWKNSLTDEPATYKNFEIEVSPSGEEDLCSIAETHPSLTGLWDIEQCHRELCTACQFPEPQPLRIRGLCKKSLFDRAYYLWGDSNTRPLFSGQRYSEITWVSNTTATGLPDLYWKMYQVGTPVIQAKLKQVTHLEYPIGVNEWEIQGDKCAGDKKLLKMTSCTEGKYTCDDGVCIDQSKRCNLEIDCGDQTDELGCDTVVIPMGYARKLPPPKRIKNQPVNINVKCSILLIRQLNLLNNEIVVDLLMQRTWYDSRLRYKNLQSDNNLNTIEDLTDNLWYPDVTFIGSDDSYAGTDILRTRSWAQRSSNPNPDNDEVLEEDVFYEGVSNPMILERQFTIRLSCTFELSRYPFDVQRCPMTFYVGDYTPKYVITNLSSALFTGTKKLLEYEVVDLIQSAELYNNRSAQQITIVLVNLYGYYISSAYIPTLLLVIISYYCFYFDIQDFTNRIMVALTSMLVQAGLFSQVASGLPRTAYLKAIDTWFIFCIISEFVMVSLLVLINGARLYVDSMPVGNMVSVISPTSMMDSENKSFQKIYWKDAKNFPGSINRFSQIGLPVMMLAFIFGYIIYVVEYIAKVENRLDDVVY